MEINDSWFIEYIQGWDNEIQWELEDLLKISKVLCDIATLNGAEIAWDKNKDDFPSQMARKYAILRCDEAIQKRMNYYLNHYFPSKLKPLRLINTASSGFTLPFLHSAKWSNRININTATKNELISLPKIGSVIAGRIIEYRLIQGFFSNEEQLLSIKGIYKDTIKEISDLITLGKPERYYFKTLEADFFFNNPSISSYIKWTKAANGNFSGLITDNNSLTDIILDEITSIRDEVKSRPSLRGRTLSFTRATEANALINLYEGNDNSSIGGGEVNDLKVAAVLNDGLYRKFIEQLIDESTLKILIIMFFFKFDDEKSYPTDTIVDKLIDAKNRGVNVRVILDRDAEGDKYGSRVINKNVKEYLSAAGIEVKMDRPDILTHAKAIVVDNLHVVVGSHNWTAGSFYAYDDTSIYVESKEIANNLENVFNVIWSNSN